MTKRCSKSRRVNFRPLRHTVASNCSMWHAHDVIAIWNLYAKRVDYFIIIRRLPFCIAASVLQFNRYSQCRRTFWQHTLAAVITVLPSRIYYSARYAQDVWHLHSAVVYLFSKHVRVPPWKATRFSGPLLTSRRSSNIFLRISAERKANILAISTAPLVSRSQCLPKQVASFILHPFSFQQVRQRPAFSLSWNGSILTLLHSRPSLLKRLSSFFTPTYRLVASIRSTLYVIGRYVREQALRARFRGDDPDDLSFSYSADRVPTWVYDFFRVLKSCIGQLEILAVLFAYMTLPKQITPAKHVTSDRLVLHYIDNTSLIAGAIKGYSSRPDSSKLLTLTILHIIFSILKTAPWFAARYLKLIDWLASVHAPSQAPRDSGARARNAELASRRVFARAPRESGLDH